MTGQSGNAVCIRRRNFQQKQHPGDLEGSSSVSWGDKPLMAVRKGLCSWVTPSPLPVIDGWQTANSLEPAPQATPEVTAPLC